MGKLPGIFDNANFALRQLLAEFNGKVDVIENLSTRLVEAAPGNIAANTQQEIEHRLGRVPRGVILVGIEIRAGATSSVPGIIYYTDTDLALWTEEVVYLRYTVSWNLHVTKMVFF